MNKISDQTRAVIREEYRASIDRPTLAQLAEKYGLSARTVQRWSATEHWNQLRDSYWRQLAEQTADSQRQRSEQGARKAANEHEKNVAIVGGARDRLAAVIMMRKEELLAMWDKVSYEKRAQFYPSYCRAVGELSKLAELFGGGVTARIDLLSSPEWREFEEVLFEVLEDHPAARDALLEKLDRGTWRP